MDFGSLLKLLSSSEVTKLLNQIVEKSSTADKTKLEFINLLVENMDDKGKVDVKDIIKKLVKHRAVFDDEEFGMG
jgi:coenzyme F420-reducing hydrogenase alpha subunit